MSTSTIKISELTQLSDLDSNTSNTLFVVDALTSNITATVSATTLSQHLFANNTLIVGQNPVIFDNTIAQLSNTDPSFIQVNIQNYSPNGSADLVLTADDGTNTSAFVDLGINNSQWDSSVLGQTAQYPYDGFLIVDGPLDDPKGNLVIGTANPSTNLVFSIGGLTTTDVPAVMTANGLVFKTNRYLTFADNTQQTTAAATLEYSESAFAVANTATDSITYLSGVNLGQNTYASAAFAKANSALANTSGTFAGDLTITGNTQVAKVNTANLSVVGTANIYGTLNVVGVVSMNSTLVLTNTSFSATDSALTISATPTVQTPSQAGTMLHISGKANTPSRIIFDSFSTDGSAYGIVAGRTARGTVTTPTATQNNDILMRVAGNGWGTTGFAPLGVARIDIIATENYTDSARGSKIVMYNIANGSNTVQEIASFNADIIEFTGTVRPDKGFIYVPTILSGSQTAFTIDFSTTSLIKASLDADCTISLSNYVAGKVVEVWLTNTFGSNRTVTHGCTALNSTVNSTTFTIPATSSAYLKYFSIDGDNANTFVAVTLA